ncbi:MAG: ribonuclease HI [Thermoplasmata archaeon]
MDDAEIPRGVATAEGGDVHVHFDGACQPPKGPGVATFGFTIQGAGMYAEECGLATRPYSEHSTNNVAEYVAAIRALEWLRAQGYKGPVIVSGDSQLVIRQMRGEYRVRTEHLEAYRSWLARLAGEFATVDWRWVPRADNARADALSKRALDGARPGVRRHRADVLPTTPRGPGPEASEGDDGEPDPRV